MVLGLGIANELLEYPTAWTPMDQGLNLNLKQWLQGGVGVSEALWIDSSLSGNHASQSVAENRPSLSETNPQGLEFDQTVADQFLNFNKFTILEDTAFTFVFVIKLDSNTNQVLYSDSNNEFVEILNNKSFRIKTNNPGEVTTVLKTTESVFTTSNTLIVYLSRSGQGRFVWRINGENIGIDSGNSSNIVNAGGFDLENLCIRNDNDRGFDGQLREVLLYAGISLDDAANISKMTNLHNYLADKYNITVNID